MNGSKAGFLAVVLALASASSTAATYYVSEAYGDDGNNGTSWATPFKTLTPFTGGTPTKSLQWNTVIVSNGTYKISEPLYMNCQTKFKGLSTNPEDTVIDGQGLTPVFYMAYSSGNNMGSVYNLTVQGGFLDTANPPAYRTFSGGAGIFIGNDNRNIVSNCVVRDCHVKVNTGAAFYGGGVYCYQGTIYDLVVSNCTIAANATNAKAYGGGVYITNCQLPDGLFITNCHTKVLSGSNVDSYGGGLYSTVTGKAKRTRIVGCTAAARGGGACFTTAGTYRNYYVANCTANAGGGIAIHNSGITLAASTVTNCTAASGGGLYLSQNNATLTNCVVVANTATSAGGGVYCENGRSGIAFVDSVLRGNKSNGTSAVAQFGSYRFNTVSFIRCVIEGNTSSGSGALTSTSSCYNSKLWDCIVTGNRGQHLIYHYANAGEYPTAGVKEWWIRNCYIARNNSTYLQLFYLSNVPSKQTCSVVDHCTIVDNNKASGCTDKYVFSAISGWGTLESGTNNYISANVIYNNGGDDWRNFYLGSQDLIPNVKYNYTTGVPMAAQNNYNPATLPPADQFRNWTAGDWRLMPRSALVDQDTTVVCDCDWMKVAGVTDLGDGTYSLEPVYDHGVHIVFNNTKKRWLGDSPDIGCFELRPKRGIVLMIK